MPLANKGNKIKEKASPFGDAFLMCNFMILCFDEIDHIEELLAEEEQQIYRPQHYSAGHK